MAQVVQKIAPAAAEEEHHIGGDQHKAGGQAGPPAEEHARHGDDEQGEDEGIFDHVGAHGDLKQEKGAQGEQEDPRTDFRLHDESAKATDEVVDGLIL